MQVIHHGIEPAIMHTLFLYGIRVVECEKYVLTCKRIYPDILIPNSYI